MLGVGGNDDGLIKVGELYDSLTEKWTLTGSTHDERLSHTASVLFDGKVLVTEGAINDVDSTNSTELYNPAAGEWTSEDSMEIDRV